MSKIASIFLFVLMAGAGYGQQEHFALIRTDNDQPFYVRIRQQTQSSSAEGHLILSQLHDSLYPIAIGFPRQQFPEQEFILKIDGKDLDLQLIYRQEKGWVLVDRITQEEELPGNDPTKKKTHLEGIKKDDAFSRLMADVVSDTSVMYNTYAEEASRDSAARIADSIAARKAADSLAVRNADSLAALKAATLATATLATATLAAASPTAAASLKPASSPGVSPPAASPLATSSLEASPPTGSDSAAIAILRSNLPSAGPDLSVAHTTIASDTVSTRKTSTRDSAAPPPAKPAHIEKIAEQRTATGLRISYTDRGKGRRTDTIDIQIPLDSIQKTPVPHTDSVRPALQTAQAPGAPPQTAPPQTAKAKLVVINTDCHNFATDDDVDKLRLKFQTLSGDDAKIAAAKKIFKLKCFTTNQLKALTESFPAEEGKYRFLEASYPFVSDDGFKELSGLFTDPIYIAKFKTLVGAP